MIESMKTCELKRFAKKLGVAKPIPKDKQQLIDEIRKIIAEQARINNLG